MGYDRTYPMMGKNLANQIGVSFVVFVPLLLVGLAVFMLWGKHISLLDVILWGSLQLIGGIGITLGYHRMTTHGAFTAKAPAKAFLLWSGIQSLQGGPASWAATHRRHHALADKPGDPHSPLEGLWHAHIGWMIKGNLVHSGPAYERLLRDPMIRFFERTQPFWYVMTFLTPALIAFAIVGTWGAFWQAAFWAGAIRIFLMHHITWSINSICHAWGTRPYDSPDVARNNAIFGVFGFGEGWHNNHHAFPDSAYLGHRWYQFDLGKYVLWVLRAVRLVGPLKVPTKEQRKQRIRSRQSTKMPASS